LARRLAEAARESGVLPGDPLEPLVDAFARTIIGLARGQRALTESTEAAVKEFDSLLRAQRDLLKSASDRARAEARNAEAKMLERVADASAIAAGEALSQRARALDRRAAAVVGMCIVCAVLIGSAAGWFFREQWALAARIEEEARFGAAFRDGPEAAAIWIDLMRWNDARVALENCRRPEEVIIQNRRRACRLLFWVEKQADASR
jgi:ElaB/YqjD/DUF883 family membrane-anchored ribosome-binding protein